MLVDFGQFQKLFLVIFSDFYSITIHFSRFQSILVNLIQFCLFLVDFMLIFVQFGEVVETFGDLSSQTPVGRRAKRGKIGPKWRYVGIFKNYYIHSAIEKDLYPKTSTM